MIPDAARGSDDRLTERAPAAPPLVQLFCAEPFCSRNIITGSDGASAAADAWAAGWMLEFSLTSVKAFCPAHQRKFRA